MLTAWVRDGTAIVEQLVPHDLIDAMVAEIDGLFTAASPRPGLHVEDLRIDGTRVPKLSHAAVLELPPATRAAAHGGSSWRVHAFFEHSAAADAIRRHDELVRLATMILGRPCDAHYSINFHNGSQQDLHEDAAVFQLGVPTLICGAWIACEDVVEGAGPLVYFPGSHRRAMWDGFSDYPRRNLQTADPASVARYNGHLATESARFESRTFLARKGDVLFWHGMLIHGGAPITSPATTRRSYVVHFIPDGVDVSGAGGPLS